MPSLLVVLVGLVALTAAMLTGASVGRWLVVRVLGVRGVPFPFGANARWCWTTASVVPQALGLLGSLAGMYAVPGAAIAAGTWSAGVVEADETSMRLVVDPTGPAFDADVRDGDRVLSVNGERMTSWDAFRGAVARHPGEAIDLSVTRDGREVHALVTPDASGRIHVRMPMVHRDAGLGECLGLGAVGPVRALYGTARGVLDTLSGSARVEVSAPVAIVHEASLRPPQRGSTVAFLGLLGAYLLPFMAIAALFVGPGRRRKAPTVRAGTP